MIFWHIVSKSCLKIETLAQSVVAKIVKSKTRNKKKYTEKY